MAQALGWRVVARVFSGIQPSGGMHLGNLLGALRNWVAYQHEHEAVYCVVDLHALTTAPDPTDKMSKSLDSPGACALRRR